MIWLAAIIFSFLILRLGVAVSNLLARQWLKKGTPGHPARVSVLIPARNEEKNIENLLRGLLQQDWPLHEILIYDDLSEDNTPHIVGRMAAQEPLIRYLKGNPLPRGWLGKNHACHQLAAHATGQYLLFLDADVVPKPGLVSSALGYMQRYHLHLLSLFPSQIMNSAGEKVSIPLMNWVLLSLLPLALTRRSGHPAFAAANGQFMMFEAAAYHQHQFHEQVRHHQVEDIRIARMMKRNKLRIQTLLGGRLIYCRMYDGFRTSVDGFSKNVLEFFGGSLWAGPLFAIITTLGIIPVWLATGLQGLLVYLAMTLTIRLVVTISSHQPIKQNLLLWPFQHGAFMFIMLMALKNRLRGKNTWKGRNIDQV